MQRRNRFLFTIHRNQRLVSLAVRRVTLAGAMSGGAGRVWILLEGWLGGLVPTMFTWRIRNLVFGVKHYYNAASANGWFNMNWNHSSESGNSKWTPSIIRTLAVCILLREDYCIWTEITALNMNTVRMCWVESLCALQPEYAKKQQQKKHSMWAFNSTEM